MSTPHRIPDGDRPSPASCARFAVDLHHQLASSRLAWDAALLRSDAAVASGDPAEIAAAIEDHRLLLASLQDRVGSLLAQAADDHAPEPVVTVEALATRAAPETSAVPELPTSEAFKVRAAAPRPDEPHTRASPSALRRGAASLLGAAAAVALVAGLTVAALPQLDDGPTSLAAHPGEQVDGPQLGDEVVTAGDTVTRVSPPVVPHTVGPIPELAPFSLLPPGGGTEIDGAAGEAVPDDAERGEDLPRDGRDAEGSRPDVAEGATEPATLEVGPVAPEADEIEDLASEGSLSATLEEVGEWLTDPQLGSSEVTGALPDPVSGLGERLRRSLRPEPASEPGTELR